MVTGTVTHVEGLETGVVVNGVVAMVYGDQFAANHVPLNVGENTITVLATDTTGNSIRDSITVNASANSDYIILGCNYASTLAPLNATLRVLSTFSSGGTPTYTVYGPGDVVFGEIDSMGTVSISMEIPGLYFFTASVQAENDEIYNDETAVLVIDLEQLDPLLKAKWNGMKQALISCDIQGAVAMHHPSVRNKYEAIYNSLGDQRSSLASQMQDIELIFAEDGRAKYRIRKEQTVDGNLETITYYINFYFDENGIWRIENY
jgi:hypothetical protein